MGKVLASKTNKHRHSNQCYLVSIAGILFYYYFFFKETSTRKIPIENNHSLSSATRDKKNNISNNRCM